MKIRRKGERLAIIVRPGRYLQPESVDRERGRRFEESGDAWNREVCERRLAQGRGRNRAPACLRIGLQLIRACDDADHSRGSGNPGVGQVDFRLQAAHATLEVAVGGGNGAFAVPEDTHVAAEAGAIID